MRCRDSLTMNPERLGEEVIKGNALHPVLRELRADATLAEEDSRTYPLKGEGSRWSSKPGSRCNLGVHPSRLLMAWEAYLFSQRHPPTSSPFFKHGIILSIQSQRFRLEDVWDGETRIGYKVFSAADVGCVLHCLSYGCINLEFVPCYIGLWFLSSCCSGLSLHLRPGIQTGHLHSCPWGSSGVRFLHLEDPPPHHLPSVSHLSNPPLGRPLWVPPSP